MVFKHNKQPFADEDCYQFAYKNTRQLDCAGQIQSFVDFSSFEGVPVKHPISEGQRESIFSHFRGKERCRGDAIIPNDSASSALCVDSGSSLFTSDSSEAARSLHSKRPFSEGESDEVALKRARQVDQNSQLDSSVVDSFSGTSAATPNSVVAGEELENRKSAALSEDPTKNVLSSILSLPLFKSTPVEERTRLESPIRLSSFPAYFEDGHRTTRFNQREATYSHFFDYTPRKCVPIGPNHQADLPIWRSRGFKSSFEEEDNSDKWMGTCVMRMPNSNSLALDVGLGENKTGCMCPEEGSIRCVRQHVMEAREKLKKTLGHHKFLELGFYDMGEGVAQRWTEEEEQLFHEVVATNPASLGRNFWDNLPRAFPSRSSKELVSYYFNVFILQKRAEQNRADPLNADSDNDEWQEEDDEDSVVESPAGRDDVDRGEAHTHEESEDGDESYDDDEELYIVSEGCISDKSKKSMPRDGAEDQCVNGDSCTSSEGQHDSLVEHGGYGNDGLCGIYLEGHCEPRTWELSYIRGPGKDIDFLPTCHVIEEFGKGSWEN